MRRSILLTTPILAVVIAGCSSTSATPSPAKSTVTAAAAPSSASAESTACTKLGSQPWKIDPADSGDTEDQLRGFRQALPSQDELTGDLVDAEADLTVLDGEADGSSPDAATYKEFTGLLLEDVQKIQADCQSAGVTITIKLSPQPSH